MDRQSSFLLALGSLIAAAAFVSAAGWYLFVRDRRSSRATERDGSTDDEPDRPAASDQANDPPTTASHSIATQNGIHVPDGES